MKKILFIWTLLGLIVSNVCAEEWYILGGKTNECFKEEKYNPYNLKSAGYEVRDEGNGVFTVNDKGTYLLFINSKELCDKVSKAIKK